MLPAPALDREQLRGHPPYVRRDPEKVLGPQSSSQQRLVSVAERGVGDLDRDPLPQIGGKARRTEISSRCREPLGEGNVEIDPGGPFLPGSSWVGAGPCG